ncbi:mitochondrial ribosomal protein 10 [Aulographum hederae CBS 113979]|uniref:Small ribosomal subunit protein mS37 n=1 Tax=Aulographum hederae CBS 113979 TaxID=1176131 RepID=A0A6G1GTE1_9PEZI|nr:mitochondrial ribosomal protein 10 [Aulographum hederae CBS 113979]
MVPKPSTVGTTRAGNSRLPPLPKLRVRRPNRESENPCIPLMSSVLGCWASSGFSITGCAQLEQALRLCMDQKRNTSTQKNNINYHLSRMYPKIVGPHKKK